MSEQVLRRKWFPATVRVNGETWRQVAVFVGSEAVEVYRAPGALAWRRVIDWEKTSLPKGRRAAVDVMTDQGETLVVTPGGGCRCGGLGRWKGPGWASTEAAAS